MASEFYLYYRNHNGGTNNLCICKDREGIWGSSTVSEAQAIMIYKAKKEKWLDAQAKLLATRKITFIGSAKGKNMFGVGEKL